MKANRTIVLWLAIAVAMSLPGRAAELKNAPPDATQQSRAPLPTVEQRVAALERKVEKPAKDIWDKTTAVSGMVSAILVAIIGFYAANIYNRKQQADEQARKNRELSTNQAEVVERLFPHLASGDQRLREAALLTIASLVSEELAAKLAVKFGGEGASAAVAKIAATSNLQSPEFFGVALGQLFMALRPSIVRISAGDQTMANGFFVDASGLIVTAAHVVRHHSDEGIRVVATDGRSVQASVVVVDEARDLALLQVNLTERAIPVSLESSNPLLGSSVIALWQSATEGLRGEVGTIAALGLTLPFAGIPEIGISLSSLMLGSSGAPVMNTSGQLVGVIHAYSTETQVTYLIPAKEVQEMVSANGRSTQLFTEPDS